ncbi:MAG TPA: FtsQ-type POTRA domain-containing protein [Syntrophorhabdaceae bacterium]|jgi:cell division protein FtsQ
MKKTLTLFFLIPLCVISTLTVIYLFSKEEPLFFLKNIKINGVRQIEETDVMSRVAPFLRESILSIDAAKMKEAITANPLVREVSIKRVFPFSIVIDVKEKQASALWINGDGKIMVLDESGSPYRGLKKGDDKDLYIINAREKAEAKSLYREISGWVREGIIKKDALSEIAYNDGNITLFGLENGVEIILGKEEQDKRLKRAVAVFEDAKKRGLLIKCIDARFEKGAIIQERKG